MTKQEKMLCEAIRSEIRRTLREAGYLDRAKSMVKSKVDKMGKLNPVKMLKRALGTGSADQKAAGLLKIIQSVIGDDPKKAQVLLKLKQRMGQSKVRGEI